MERNTNHGDDDGNGNDVDKEMDQTWLHMRVAHL